MLTFRAWFPWLALSALLTAFAACSTATAPAPSGSAIGVRDADPLVAARAFGVHDARIAKLLEPVPAAPQPFAAKRGFNAARASYGYRSADDTAAALRMPQVASGAIFAGAGSNPKYQIELTPQSASAASQAELREGLIAYRDAYTDTDLVASASERAAELLFLLKSNAAPKRFAWQAQLPPGIDKVESRNDGLWFLDASGNLVVHIPEPYAVDADGKRQAALIEYDSARSELQLTLTSDAGLRYPILLDPVVETEVWVEVQAPPNAQNHQMIFDDARKLTVMFGGNIPLNQTWTWDGLNWRKRVGGRADVPVPSAAVAGWDPERKLIVAVGSETATWDGAKWNEVVSPQAPTQRSGATLTWDAARKQFVLFGGNGSCAGSQAGSSYCAETWLFDGTAWRMLPRAMQPGGDAGADAAVEAGADAGLDAGPPAAETEPRARAYHSAAWDDVRKQVIVVGGYGSCLVAVPPATTVGFCVDSWAFDGVKWSQIVGTVPAPRQQGVMAWDASLRRVVLLGGNGPCATTGNLCSDTWIYDANGWQRISTPSVPPGRYAPNLLFNPAVGKMVFFGGYGGSACGPNGYCADTWVLNNNEWAPLANVGLVGRSQAAAALDIARNQIVLFGGYGICGAEPGTYGPCTDTQVLTYELGLLRWKTPARAVTPPGRSQASMVWDDANKRAILFGGSGQCVIPSGSYGNCIDTWLFDGGSWSKHPGLSPTPRSGQSLTWDSAGGQFVLFGGNGECLQPGVNVYCADTWVFKNSAWTPLFIAGPPARSGHVVVWDQAQRALVLFGGYGPCGPGGQFGTCGDTWKFQNNQWSPIARSEPQPASRQLHQMVAETDRVVLFGGYSNNATCGSSLYPNYCDDTWELRNATWTKIQVPGGTAVPPARYNGLLAWDPELKKSVLVGGSSAPGAQATESWALSGSTWTKAGAVTQPRNGMSVTWDAGRKKLVLFGGSSLVSAAAPLMFDGTNWQSIIDREGNGPSPRGSHFMVYDESRSRHVLFGGNGNLADTWLLYLRGGDCTQDSQCGSGHCTDGKCCESVVCGVCETCAGAGASLGKCTPVLGKEDPDSCASKQGKSCDSRGACVTGLGVACTDGAGCSTGNCVEGVCCDEKCDGACKSCKASEKAEGADGVCGLAKADRNPGNRCKENAVCAKDGTCVRSSRCKNERTSVDGQGNETSCGDYRCDNNIGCLSTCRNVADCNLPAVCTSDFKCALVPDSANAAGCCATSPAAGSPRAGCAALLAFAAASALAAHRRRRRSRDQKSAV